MRKFAQRASCFDIANHQRKWFMRSVFAAAKFSYRDFIGGIARKQKAAQAFNRKNFPFSK